MYTRDIPDFWRKTADQGTPMPAVRASYFTPLSTSIVTSINCHSMSLTPVAGVYTVSFEETVIPAFICCDRRELSRSIWWQLFRPVA